MLPIHTILHPTDFSAASDHAFQVACALARDYVARLVVLHVKPFEMMYAGDDYILPSDPEAARQAKRAQLDRLRPPDPALQVERLLAEGDAVHEILHAAQEVHADVIVLGTHGRTGVGRLLMGSVAEAVLRKAPCPVLTVKTPLPKTEVEPEEEAEAIASGPGLIRFR